MRCPYRTVFHEPRTYFFSQAKVSNSHLSCLIHHQICSLDVPMDYMISMHVIESVKNLWVK